MWGTDWRGARLDAGNPSRTEAWTREADMGSKEGAPLDALQGKYEVGCLQGQVPSTRFHSPFEADPGLGLLLVPARRSSASTQAPWKEKGRERLSAGAGDDGADSGCSLLGASVPALVAGVLRGPFLIFSTTLRQRRGPALQMWLSRPKQGK